MRRNFLIGGAVGLATLLLPRHLSAGAARRISLKHAATGARFDGAWHDGLNADAGAMMDLSAVLADPGCVPPRPFDAETIGIVWEIAQLARLTGDLDIHSGYRTPRVNRAVHGAGDSHHLRASAMDVGVPTGRMPAVAEAAMKLGKGGVGVYRSRGFIHLDSGPVRSWSDSGAMRVTLSPREQQLERIASEWGRAGRTTRLDTRLPDTYR